MEAWGTPDALGQRWEVERVLILVVLELLLKPGMVTNTFFCPKKIFVCLIIPVLSFY